MSQASSAAGSITSSVFGTMEDGRQVTRYTLVNTQGMAVDILDYGGIITRWTAPDREGNYQDVVLGFETLEPYLERHPYFGALVGRYANRIALGKFTLDDKEYTLATNNGPNHLHGGDYGFDRKLWKAEVKANPDSLQLQLEYLSPDGEEGFPGNLRTRVLYSLSNDNTLSVEYQATTDRPTVLNLTQHTYFNLSGNFNTSITDHNLQLQAESLLEVDADLIPTGNILPVEGTPFDFREVREIGADIDADHPQIKLAGGYDHCWIFTDGINRDKPAAQAYHPLSGRLLEVFTDQPAIQVYTANFLQGKLRAKGGGTYPYRAGLCLETQHYPDAPNRPEFPSTRLDPGLVFTSKTSFRFSVK
ncbi:aldose 1-epimerase [Robiginitalea myxolifaciens]|uniref:Aldose 1-epimerase n=1 Tax=Robiginitalea myxolifaciens TaxID=400055 RepID=A0A1I6HJN1_9FLAO|nr:aldose epimerase family protein [Robiginitalea myxolifaciens]SFR54618.1 aldose 1-epimerase [Robiginitalea myxolifaciens]